MSVAPAYDMYRSYPWLVSFLLSMGIAPAAETFIVA